METADIIQIIVQLGATGVLYWRLQIRDAEVVELNKKLDALNERLFDLLEKTERITKLIWTDDEPVDTPVNKH